MHFDYICWEKCAFHFNNHPAVNLCDLQFVITKVLSLPWWLLWMLLSCHLHAVWFMCVSVYMDTSIPVMRLMIIFRTWYLNGAQRNQAIQIPVLTDYCIQFAQVLWCTKTNQQWKTRLTGYIIAVCSECIYCLSLLHFTCSYYSRFGINLSGDTLSMSAFSYLTVWWLSLISMKNVDLRVPQGQYSSSFDFQQNSHILAAMLWFLVFLCKCKICFILSISTDFIMTLYLWGRQFYRW